jgi:hypothetical protein
MALQYSTPGVYIEELDAFPHSIVEVPTAIPAFIGYTEFATDENGNPLNGVPYQIQSQSDYETYFGKGFKSIFPITATGDLNTATGAPAVTRFYLYDSIRLFYANGGGQCYILSVGAYGGSAVPAIAATDLTPPLDINTGVLLKVEDVTLIVIPDAVALTETQAYNQVYTQVLTHCNFMQSRMGIFDLIPQPNDNTDNGLYTSINNFRGSATSPGIGINYLNYGAAYFPWLESGVVQDTEIDFNNLSIPPANFAQTFTDGNVSAIYANYNQAITTAAGSVTTAKAAVTAQQAVIAKAAAAVAAAQAGGAQVPAATQTTLTNAQNALAPLQATLTQVQAASAVTAASAARAFQLAMVASSPTYNLLMTKVSAAMNLLPPSGAIAGVYTSVDNNNGVWKAPANVSLNSVDAPSADFNRNMTDNLNVDAVSGKSINAIRSFPGQGTLVFGARTLDGNSQDWRYISVRRTLIMMEQSIKVALRAYVFEPNDDSTWITVKSMITNFLTNLWKQGALAGAKPEDAFQVMCGLNVTMTAQDILDGYMRITVLVAVVHPAEFIVLTFQQELQTS